MQLRAPITDTGNLEQRETPACSCVQRPPLNPGNRDPVSTSTSSGPTSTRPRQRPSEHLYPISAPATPVSNVPVDTRTHQRSGPHQWRLRHSPMTIARLHPADDSNDPSPCPPDATPPCPLLDPHAHDWPTTMGRSTSLSGTGSAPCSHASTRRRATEIGEGMPMAPDAVSRRTSSVVYQPPSASSTPSTRTSPVARAT